MNYFPIKYETGATKVSIFQESLQGQVQRYTDLLGNTVTLPKEVEVFLVDKAPQSLDWWIKDMTYVQFVYVAREQGALIYAEITRFTDVDGKDNQFPAADTIKSIQVADFFADPPPWGK